MDEVDSDVDRLIEAANWLIANPGEARRMGERARAVARERFGIARFARDWDRVFREFLG